jgi:hypothetical protein
VALCFVLSGLYFVIVHIPRACALGFAVPRLWRCAFLNDLCIRISAKLPPLTMMQTGWASPKKSSSDWWRDALTIPPLVGIILLCDRNVLSRDGRALPSDERVLSGCGEAMSSDGKSMSIDKGTMQRVGEPLTPVEDISLCDGEALSSVGKALSPYKGTMSSDGIFMSRDKNILQSDTDILLSYIDILLSYKGDS